jgi:hypothetical protein
MATIIGLDLDKDGLLFDEGLNGVGARALDRDVAKIGVGTDYGWHAVRPSDLPYLSSHESG